MKTIVLLMCGRNKLNRKSNAEDMYISPRFKRDLCYAKTLTSEENIFILSAKHHLLRLKQEIEPYDECLNDMTQGELSEWTNKVLAELKKYADFETDKFIILAEDIYKKGILSHLKYVKEITLEENK